MPITYKVHKAGDFVEFSLEPVSQSGLYSFPLAKKLVSCLFVSAGLYLREKEIYYLHRGTNIAAGMIKAQEIQSDLSSAMERYLEFKEFLSINKELSEGK